MKLVLVTFFVSMASCACATRNVDATSCARLSTPTESACVIDAKFHRGSESYYVLNSGAERKVVVISNGTTNEIISLPAVDYSDSRLIFLQGGGVKGGNVLVLEDHYYETEPGDQIYQWQLIDIAAKREFGIISAGDIPSAKADADAWLISASDAKRDAGVSGAATFQRYYCIHEGSLHEKNSGACR